MMSKKILAMMCGVAVLVTASICCGAVEATNEASEQRETFGKWHIGVGAAFNGRVKSRLGFHRLPKLGPLSVEEGLSKANAWRQANAHLYDHGGYIAPDSLDNGYATENWKLPAVNYLGNGQFDLENAYREVLGTSYDDSHGDDSDSKIQYGLSVEVSRELWIHDEKDEHRRGVDFAAAFSYFFQRNVLSRHDVMTRREFFRDGAVRTTVEDPDAMWNYDHGLDNPIEGLYGHGNFNPDHFSPALGWDAIRPSRDVPGPTRSVETTSAYSAHGDYRELEMLFMLRPWYEIYDWWRVYAQIGVGVSWGRFETVFRSPDFVSSEDFSQWDCYGVAGLGTVFRYKRIDIMVDFLGRFLRDDLEVDGRFANGHVDRADWGLRLMLGYEF